MKIKRIRKENFQLKFQTDESGYVPVAFLRHVLTTEGEKLTDEQLDEAVKQIEVDGDGKIRCEGRAICYPFVNAKTIAHNARSTC